MNYWFFSWSTKEQTKKLDFTKILKTLLKDWKDKPETVVNFWKSYLVKEVYQNSVINETNNAAQKWGKDVNRYFIKDDTWMSNTWKYAPPH